MPESAASLKHEAGRLGFQLVGVCDVVPPPHFAAYKQWVESGYAGEMTYLSDHLPLKADPRRLLPGAASIIAVGLNYNQDRPQIPEGPTISKYALGRDYHRVLRGKLTKLANWISAAFPGSQCRACVDSAPIMERDYAQLAGLGWFGKNTMLINSERGSWFFLGILLTTVPFELDRPSVGSCGSCQKCIEACPTGAIVYRDERWQIDARRCISYLTIEHDGPIAPDLAEKMGGWTVGCDVCQDVCPFNEPRPAQPLRAPKTAQPDFQPRPWPPLIQLTSIGEQDWDTLTRGRAARRVNVQKLRRNAAINLANRASADVPEDKL